jgi:selenide,water dikinase
MPPGLVHACTDITGFGFVGHASGMAKASGVTLRCAANALPVFDGVLALAAANTSGGLTSNREHFGAGVRLAPDVPSDLETVLYDPQTSGGLLIAVAEPAAGDLERRLADAGAPSRRVGTVVRAEAGVLLHVTG